MSSGGEVDWLRRAVELCSRSAAAYKAAFMLTPISRLERHLLDRCTERYALLEHLLGFLLEHGMAAEGMRAMLERLDTDPARHARFENALAEACSYDRELVRLIDRALSGGLRLPAALGECLAAKRRDLEAHGQGHGGAMRVEETVEHPLPLTALPVGAATPC
ncbi:hypothetical protein [Benzoatithermus flavus]|uniref:Uncharacterized protein n=1 Tax=Benzoatithermus flavus TaxID=3108223 RepID=A0ABU8XMH2_9PROT